MLEMEYDDKSSGKINGTMPHRLVNYNINTPNINDDSIDFCVNNANCRVDTHCEFYDEDAGPLMLLNLDDQNKRKATFSGYNCDDEPPYKRSIFRSDEEEETDIHGWRMKPIEDWVTSDTKNWLFCTGLELGHSYVNMSPALAMPGKDLLHLTRLEFARYDRLFGERLFDSLHVEGAWQDYLPPFDTLKSFSDDETSVGSENNNEEMGGITV